MNPADVLDLWSLEFWSAYGLASFLLARRAAGRYWQVRKDYKRPRYTEGTNEGDTAGVFFGILFFWPLWYFAVAFVRTIERFPTFFKYLVLSPPPRKERRMAKLEASRKRTAELEKELGIT